jgi:hypothetical protein
LSELRKGGHSVVTPADAGLVGAPDARHLIHAIRQFARHVDAQSR